LPSQTVKLSLSFPIIHFCSFDSDLLEKRLGDAGAVAFAEALRKNTHLKIAE
jgi:hypothetical protein